MTLVRDGTKLVKSNRSVQMMTNTFSEAVRSAFSGLMDMAEATFFERNI